MKRTIAVTALMVALTGCATHVTITTDSCTIEYGARDVEGSDVGLAIETAHEVCEALS